MVLVRPGETVRIRTRLMDFPGRTMHPCPILDHEALGMTGSLRINA